MALQLTAMELYNHGKWHPEPHQIRIMAMALKACIPYFYRGGEFQARRNQLSTRYKISLPARQECAVAAPRRWGKTESIAMFTAALLYSNEGMEIAIFAASLRQTKWLLDAVYKHLCALNDAGKADHIIGIKRTRHAVQVVHAGPVRDDGQISGIVSTITAYPCIISTYVS